MTAKNTYEEAIRGTAREAVEMERTNMELETLVKTAKKAEVLRCGGIIGIERGCVRMTPEAYLELFPGDREALRAVGPLPGAYVRLEETVDGVRIFTFVPTVRAGALADEKSERRQAKQEIQGAAEGECHTNCL